MVDVFAMEHESVGREQYPYVSVQTKKKNIGIDV